MGVLEIIGYNGFMKVRITIPDVAGRSVDETVTGTDADDVLAQVKARVAKELGWKGMFLKAMSPLAFAQMAVSRYNAAFKTTYAIPESADDFLHLGQDMGYVSLLPDTI